MSGQLERVRMRAMTQRLVLLRSGDWFREKSVWGEKKRGYDCNLGKKRFCLRWCQSGFKDKSEKNAGGRTDGNWCLNGWRVKSEDTVTYDS